MKSKKKFLLLGVGVMGALALGVGATSTFAWFRADQANQVTGGIGDKQSLTVESPTASVQNIIWAKLTFNFSDTELPLTTRDGYSLAVTNEGLKDVTANAGALFGTGSWTNTRGTGYQWYHANPTGLTGEDLVAAEATSQEVSNITSGKQLTVSATAGARTRITLTNPASSTFKAVFGDVATLAKTVSLGTVTVVAGGTLDGSLSNFYYSFAGQIKDTGTDKDMTKAECLSSPDLDPEQISDSAESYYISEDDRSITFAIAVEDVPQIP